MSEVVWCWSLNEDKVIFIFRDKNQEVKIDLKLIKYKQKSYRGTPLLKEEMVLINNLIKEHF